MVTATSAARPAGASTRTPSACAGTPATIAASPIHDVERILPGPDLPLRSGMAEIHAEKRPERAGSAAHGLAHKAARAAPVSRSLRNRELATAHPGDTARARCQPD